MARSRSPRRVLPIVGLPRPIRQLIGEYAFSIRRYAAAHPHPLVSLLKGERQDEFVLAAESLHKRRQVRLRCRMREIQIHDASISFDELERRFDTLAVDYTLSTVRCFMDTYHFWFDPILDARDAAVLASLDARPSRTPWLESWRAYMEDRGVDPLLMWARRMRKRERWIQDP